VIRRHHLQDGAADHHADRIEGTTRAQRRRRQPQAARQAEHQDRQAEASDRDQQVPPRVLHRRITGQHQHRQQGPNGRCRPQDAQALRADLQHVLGEHRQDRDDAAEQHREQVQRDRIQDDLRLPDEAQPFAEALPDRFTAADVSGRSRLDPDVHQRLQHQQPANHGQAGGQPGAGIEKAADHRAENRPGLPGGAAPGAGVGVMAARHQERFQCADRRGQEAARQSERGDHAIAAGQQRGLAQAGAHRRQGQPGQEY